jgi:hypothetical protein
VKVVHLLRRNLLDQYISHQVVLGQTGTTILPSGQPRPKVERFAVDIEHCITYVRDVRHRQKRAEEMYSAHRSFRIHYEDMLENIESSMHPLQVFLGLGPLGLRTSTQKILESAREIVTNYDSARGALLDSGLQGE